MAYTEENDLSYWKWLRKYYSLTNEQKKKYKQNLRKVENQLKKLRKKHKGKYKVLHARHDLIWIKPRKPGHWFDHVSKYNSFSDFKQAVKRFLEKDSLKSINHFDFYLFNNYDEDWQKKQITAINKSFNEIYDKNKVKWIFKPDIWNLSKKDIVEVGEIILKIDRMLVSFPYDYRYTLDTFIKRRLK